MPPTSGTFYFWDALAAAALADEGLVTFEDNWDSNKVPRSDEGIPQLHPARGALSWLPGGGRCMALSPCLSGLLPILAEREVADRICPESDATRHGLYGRSLRSLDRALL